MWFKKKTELERQILEYGKDTDTLLQFARTVAKPRIQEVTAEDIKRYYTAVVEPQSSIYRREAMMKEVRRFFRYYRGRNVLSTALIPDNPLIVGELNVRMPVMTETIKRKPGRPVDWENIKKVVMMKDELKFPFRKIGRVLIDGRVVDHSQVIKWYKRGKKANGDLSTGKRVVVN